MRLAKITALTGVLALLLLTANCSDDECVNPEPVPGPRVIGTYPLEGAVDIPTDTSITVTFDKTMDPATISAGSFMLFGPRGPVTAFVSFDSNYTATLTPLVRLAGHSVFTAHIDAGVRDVSGRTMGVPYEWTFTTDTTQLLLFPDIEFTVRDSDGDGDPDELVAGGPPGRYLRTGIDGVQLDRAVMEFPIDQIVHDSVIQALAFVTLTASSVPYGIADIEAWGYAGNGVGELADWSIGSLAIAYDSLELNDGMTIAFPMTDMINAALDSSATHVGLRIAVTGEPIIEIATSGGINDDDKPRIALIY